MPSVTLVSIGFFLLFSLLLYTFRYFFIFTNVLFLWSNAFRRQFDLANKEAMDESAEWRMKYDAETERANKCLGELNMVLSISFGFLLSKFYLGLTVYVDVEGY